MIETKRRKPVKTWVLVAIMLFAALLTTLGMLGLLSPLWTHQNINEAKPVPGNEFPMTLNNEGRLQVLNQT